MPSNPCCCCSLQTGAKAIAIFSMIKALLFVILNVVVLVQIIHFINSPETRTELSRADATAVILSLIFGVILRIAGLCLAIVLLKAAQNRNEKYSKIWLIVTGVLWILTLFQVFWVVSSGQVGPTIALIVHLIIEMYFIWVVVAFRNEILEQEAQGFVVSGSGGGDAGMMTEAGPSASYKAVQ